MTDTQIRRARTRLYLITPPSIPDIPGFRRKVEAILAAGDVACLQLRLKDSAGNINVEMTCEVSRAVTGIAQEAGVAVLINDSPSLAAELGADGVHLGWEDMPVSKARALLGPEAIIGATARNSYHRAMQAGEEGADYVAFGAFYSSQTKQNTVQAEPELLELWQAAMLIPCVAIGGISLTNASQLVRAGADFLAVSASVWQHPEGAEEAVRAFNHLFDSLAEAS